MGGGEFVGGAGEVDSVGGCGDGDVGAGVEDDFDVGAGGTGGCDDVAGEGGEGFCGKVFFANLQEIHTGFGGVHGDANKLGLPLLFVAGKEIAGGDGVAEHGLQCRGRPGGYDNFSVRVAANRSMYV